MGNKNDLMKGIETKYNSNGDIISYKFRCCVGRDENNKQIWRTATISSDDSRIVGKTPAKLAKELHDIKSAWDKEKKEEYERTNSKKDKSSIRFDDFVNTVWWPDHVMNGDHSATSISFYRYMADDLIAYFGNKKLRNITDEDIKRYNKYLNESKTKSGDDLSATTKVRHYQTLRNILLYAIRFRYINDDPCKTLAKEDKPKREKKQIDFLAPNDAARFMSALESEPIFWKTMLTLMISTGLRRGEALGIKWEDIDFNKHTISIHRNITIDKNAPDKYTEKEPKTEESIRDIPITTYIENLLISLKRDRKAKYNNTDFLPSAFVFSREHDPYKPIYPTEPTRYVTKLIDRYNKKQDDLQKAGEKFEPYLPYVSPHDLRHTAATLALESGADLNQVQKLLGHTDPTTTMAFYAGVTEEGKRRAVDGIENLIKAKQA